MKISEEVEVHLSGADASRPLLDRFNCAIVSLLTESQP
jgi:hypothetical protein